MERKPELNTKAKVDIGIACNIMQSWQWWVSVMQMILIEERLGNVEIGAIRTVGSAVPDHNKNNVIGNSVKRQSLTDANRQEVTKGFLDGESDYIFWLDDDTAPPTNVISRLLESGREFIAGVYYLPSPPHHPIAYRRDKEGLYAPIFNFSEGSLIQVDSVGMGCTLIHKSVYEKIRDNYQVFARQNGSLHPVLKSQVKNPVVEKHDKIVEPYVRAGVYHEQYTMLPEGDTRNFPFYCLEHGRTEDHYFCELADAVGIKPYLDTTIVCQHYKLKATGHEHYKEELEKEEGFL